MATMGIGALVQPVLGVLACGGLLLMVYIIWREEHFLAIGAGTVKMGAMIGAFIGGNQD